ncbi:integumentary mucin C.1 [Drosophila gunungcola]|uniref:integumentary mucin C.1 n=1 Tax=Drosophila gunungcola TaxID=103775 RepID=UPI0022E856F7|nr:integumentary mucin C.1 [Drosophila gunungcola]
MKPAVKIPIACLLFLATEIFAQDVKPEVPVDIPPEGWEPTIPTTEALPIEPSTSTTTEPITIPTTEFFTASTAEPSTTSTTEPTTIPTTESTTTSTSESTTTSTTEPSSTSRTEPSTTSTTESITTSTTEATTTSTTETTTTSTTKPNTTSTTDSTTTSTTKRTLPSSTQPTTPSTTQRDPLYPTYRPIYTRPTTYPTRNPWIWHDPTEKCYLKNEYEYRMVCYGGGWRTTAICYRCCFYENSGFAGCSKLHQGRCSWYDSGRW